MAKKTLPFFSAAWGEAARKAMNTGPSDEVKAGKLDKYWDWIDEAKAKLDCTIGLAVRDLPVGQPDCLLLHLEHGVCTRAELVSRAEAKAQATYILAGDLASWREIMSGLDPGKTIMYRKLLLEQGAVLEFFKAAYFWTESIGCIQTVPTEFAA